MSDPTPAQLVARRRALAAQFIVEVATRMHASANLAERLATGLLEAGTSTTDVSARAVTAMLSAVQPTDVGHLLRLAEQADKAHTEAQHTNWPELATAMVKGDPAELRQRLADGLGIPVDMLDNPPDPNHWAQLPGEWPPPPVPPSSDDDPAT